MCGAGESSHLVPASARDNAQWVLGVWSWGKLALSASGLIGTNAASTRFMWVGSASMNGAAACPEKSSQISTRASQQARPTSNDKLHRNMVVSCCSAVGRSDNTRKLAFFTLPVRKVPTVV